jgi:hypothetical protein
MLLHSIEEAYYYFSCTIWHGLKDYHQSYPDMSATSVAYFKLFVFNTKIFSITSGSNYKNCLLV